MTSRATYNLIHAYFSQVDPDRELLELVGAHRLDAPYSSAVDSELTVIVNAYARPEYLPLIWESFQYQARRPRETWIIQNCPEGRSGVPRNFLDEVKTRADTKVIESGLNHGCWFRLFVAALHCRTRYVVICDDDTLPGRLALQTALRELERRPGLYGGRGLVLDAVPDGPRYWSHTVLGWPCATVETARVDVVQQLWLMETSWLGELLRHVPTRLLTADHPGRECGEELYLSHVAQKLGLASYVYGHGGGRNARWSSLRGDQMGGHTNALHRSGGLAAADAYLSEFVGHGWKLLQYS